MSQIGIAKFRFKPGKKQVWLDWSKELVERREEVMQTLREEGVRLEACFLSEEEQSIYYFIEAEDFEKMQEVANNSLHAIDADHKKVKLESIEFVERLELLFRFDNKE